jgi:hypothetical protein
MKDHSNECISYWHVLHEKEVPSNKSDRCGIFQRLQETEEKEEERSDRER